MTICSKSSDLLQRFKATSAKLKELEVANSVMAIAGFVKLKREMPCP